jgi:small subunit ribosomal protein S6
LTNGVKRTYEAMFLVDSAVASNRWDEVLSAIDLVFQRADAEVISIKKWDERRLCYEIAGQKRGMYILGYFRALPAKISALDRDIRLNELFLRAMVLRRDQITDEQMEQPTPSMLNAEREDRESVQSEDDPAVEAESEVEAEVPDFDAIEIEAEENQPRPVSKGKSIL